MPVGFRHPTPQAAARACIGGSAGTGKPSVVARSHCPSIHPYGHHATQALRPTCRSAWFASNSNCRFHRAAETSRMRCMQRSLPRPASFDHSRTSPGARSERSRERSFTRTCSCLTMASSRPVRRNKYSPRKCGQAFAAIFSHDNRLGNAHHMFPWDEDAGNDMKNHAFFQLPFLAFLD